MKRDPSGHGVGRAAMPSSATQAIIMHAFKCGPQSSARSDRKNAPPLH